MSPASEVQSPSPLLKTDVEEESTKELRLRRELLDIKIEDVLETTPLRHFAAVETRRFRQDCLTIHLWSALFSWVLLAVTLSPNYAITTVLLTWFDPIICHYVTEGPSRIRIVSLNALERQIVPQYIANVLSFMAVVA